MDIVVVVIAILLAVVIGFAVHRASLCNVRAVAELLVIRAIAGTAVKVECTGDICRTRPASN